MLPGVIDTCARDAPGWSTVGDMTINGGNTKFNFSYDGMTSKDTGSNSRQLRRAGAGLDRRNEGASVELPGRVRPKRGRDDRRRHQERNRVSRGRPRTSGVRGAECQHLRSKARLRCRPSVRPEPNPNCAKAPYRFDNVAWTLGGPVLIPGTSFNINRNKLFFFFSQDLLPRTDPGDPSFRTIPTAERAKRRLSNTVENQGRLRNIRDPRRAPVTCNINSGVGPGMLRG